MNVVIVFSIRESELMPKQQHCYIHHNHPLTNIVDKTKHSDVNSLDDCNNVPWLYGVIVVKIAVLELVGTASLHFEPSQQDIHFCK